MAAWKVESIPAFCITLERRKDRWKRFQDQPGIGPLTVKRFIGVDGNTLDIKKETRITTLTKRNILRNSRRSHEELDSAGGVGCALSHIALWQWMVDNQQELCLVMEDDAVIPPDFVEKVNQSIQKSVVLKDPAQWDLWIVGGICEDLSRIPQESPESTVVRTGAFITTHCYIITLRTAKQFLKDVYPIHCHIDWWMSIYGYLNDIRILHDTECNVLQDKEIKTDIQNKNGCTICAVEDNFEKTHTLVPNGELRVAHAAEIVCIGLLGYWLYQRYIK